MRDFSFDGDRLTITYSGEDSNSAAPVIVIIAVDILFTARRKYLYMTLDKENAESLRSIGLSIGLRYNL